MTFEEENIVFAVCVICVLVVFGMAWGVFALLKAFACSALATGVQ